ncbi:MAG: hypothetical protein WC599_03955 [Bacteroidales bacterium]
MAQKHKKVIVKTTSGNKSLPFGKNNKFVNKIFLIVFIVIISITLLKVYNYIYNEKVDLGGDSAGYYILGNALANGEGYTNIHLIDKSPANHFPPGYPFVISILIKLFSNKISTIISVNGFFLWMSVLILFYLFHKFSKNIFFSFIASIFLFLNFYIMQSSTMMMSEMSFLFFSSLSFLLYTKTDFEKPFYKNLMFFAFLLSVCISYYIRTTGIAMLITIIVLLLMKKKWKYVATMAGGFILLVLPWIIRGQRLGGNPYILQLLQKNPYRPELGGMEISDWIPRFLENVQRYITREIPSGCFSITTIKYKEPIVSSEWILGVLTLIVIAYGIYKLTDHRLLVLFYIMANLGILLLWPPVWVGIRFVLPVVPLLLFLLGNGLYEIIKWLFLQMKLKNYYVVQVGLPFCFLFAIPLYKPQLEQLHDFAKSNYPNNYKNYFDIATWANQHTEINDVICCRKPELFYLYAKRYVTNYKNTLNKEEEIEFLKKAKVNYVVLEQLGYASTGRYLYPAIQRYPEKFKILYQLKDPDTYFMKFNPDLGYWGEWKNDKREGKGTYGWENGLRFEGEWKNNARNGKGTLRYPNGEKIEGYWENDKLNGKATAWAADGTLRGNFIYKDDILIK